MALFFLAAQGRLLLVNAHRLWFHLRRGDEAVSQAHGAHPGTTQQVSPSCCHLCGTHDFESCWSPRRKTGSALLDLDDANSGTATSFPRVRDTVHCREYLEDAVVVDGNVVTSRGAGTAIQFGLALIAYLCGQVCD